MDRIDAMQAFVTSVDRGSLASAARSLGHSPATVTRAIALLEGRLGMQLLHRSTRALHLTQFGETYLATCREVLTALDMTERGAAVELEQPSGLLTITAPLRFGQLHVRPILDAFLDANPAVQARLLLLDRVANLIEEGIDVAVRVAHLPDSTMVATRLGEVRRVLCAAPAYIKRCGTPHAPPALREHACIMERDGAAMELWRFASAPGKSLLPISIRPRLVVNLRWSPDFGQDVKLIPSEGWDGFDGQVTRKRHTAEFKARVALEAIKGEQTLAEIGAKHGIHLTLVGVWKKAAIEGMAATFSSKAEASETAVTAAEMTKLHAKIGQLVVERDF